MTNIDKTMSQGVFQAVLGSNQVVNVGVEVKVAGNAKTIIISRADPSVPPVVE